MRIQSFKLLSGYRILLVFCDGTSGIVDLSGLVGRGVFASWIDSKKFDQVSIGTMGELVWPDGIDLCPDALYLQITGKQPAELFPAIGRGAKCA